MGYEGAGIAAGGSAASQGVGTAMDIIKQLEAEEARRQATEAARGMPTLVGRLPTEDYGQIQYAGDYTPGMYATPESAQYQTIDEDPATRNIQMQALQRLISQADGSADAQNAAEQFQALDSANQMANAREGAIRQSMERKGQGGTGISALMRAQAAQMGANRAKEGTLDATSKAALQKLAAMQGAVGAAGSVRGQDFNTASRNAGIINDFNIFNTRARNDISRANTDVQNQAGLRNLNTRQDIGGRNTGIANMGIDRRGRDARDVYGSEVTRQNAIIGGLGGQATQASNTGNTANQLGVQGSQLFTNIGSGVSAAQNANQPKDDEEPYYR